jgi:hypothetical protein
MALGVFLNNSPNIAILNTWLHYQRMRGKMTHEEFIGKQITESAKLTNLFRSLFLDIPK